MSISDAKRLNELELENFRLKCLLAESMLEKEATKEALRKNVVSAPSRRDPACRRSVQRPKGSALIEGLGLSAAHSNCRFCSNSELRMDGSNSFSRSE